MGADSQFVLCGARATGHCGPANTEQLELRQHSHGNTMGVMKGCGQSLYRLYPRTWLVIWAIFFLVCVSAGDALSGDANSSNPIQVPQQNVSRPPYSIIKGTYAGKTICKSVDIRNRISSSEPLAECDVIEGSLKLVVIKQSNSIYNVSFPRLKEVTHFVIFYRVRGLKSYKEMFPSLAIIRGRRLFHDYALVVYENHQLTDLGLIGLKRIMRGTVRIEKNPLLCYVHTVDWARLTNHSEGVFLENGEDGHGVTEGVPCEARGCLDTCSNFTRLGYTRRACWNLEHCQIFQDSKRCHPYCAGGCSRPDSAEHCVACEHVNFNGKCMESCPKTTYMYEGWRCISKQECLSISTGSDKQFQAFNGSCILECPAGYMVAGGTCEKCENKCPKRCPGKMLDSAERVRSMRGCNIVEGPLRIQVSRENIVQELEESLSDIEEITGYLRVSYSEALVSLHFLRNLRIIHGQSLEDDYSLYFLHNPNLKSLWPNTTDLKVLRGRAFFHFNQQLCLDKIDSLLARLNISIEESIDVGRRTNGDRVACNRTSLKARVMSVFKAQAILEWESFRPKVKDYRKLIAYNVYYRESPERNASIFCARAACGGDAWNVRDFGANGQQGSEPVVQMVTGLKPFTQYAFYVETMVSETGPNATTGRSEIKFFTTAPDNPSVPRNLKVIALAPTVSSERMEAALHVQWDPPAHPNGIVTHYVVRAEYNREDLDPNFDFCKDGGDPRPVWAPRATPKPPPRNGSLASVGGRGDGECCECPAKGAPELPTCRDEAAGAGKTGIDVDETNDRIWFENELQDSIFTKKRVAPVARPGRRRRSVNATAPENASVEEPATGPCRSRKRGVHGSWCEKYEARLPASETKNSTTLTGLLYYAGYTVEVIACQEPYIGEKLCSPATMTSRKTKKIDEADNLDHKPVVSNRTAGGQLVTLAWLDPPNPNGEHVLSYVVHTRRVDGEPGELPNKKHVCPLDSCESPPCRREVKLKLPVGNVSVQVQARSMAGLGRLSEPIFLLVEDPDGQLGSETIVAIVIGLLLVLVVACFCAIFFYKRLARRQLDAIYTSWNPYYGGQVSYQPDEWEVDIEKVYFDRVIGKGSFGSVYDGTALLRASRDGSDDTEQLYRVAIKTLLEDASMYDRQAFLSEASLMKEFNCHHVVRLMGIVSNMSAKTASNTPRAPFVIMELMAKGDLKSYLRSMRPEDDGVSVPEHCPVLPHIYQMAIQIADGMAYLTQMNSVHRDLAARNCMVSEDMTIKIGDFGMTRHLYEKNYYKKGGKGLLPVRWMGPESLRDGRFTSQSDVWSFGVVLWEMVTYAAQPYQGLTNEEVINHVLNRNRMSRPENCPERLYDLMYRCWEYRPQDRPTFIELVEELVPDVGEEFSKHSFYHTQRPAMLAAAEVAVMAHDEPEPTVLTPLTGGAAAPAAGERPPRRPRMAESEDLTDEEDCDLELRPIEQRHPRADPEANYAEFEAMKLEGRNGGHGSLSSSAENSKAHSLQFSSSDGSKGSKASNGSARNGYIAGGALSHLRTAEC